jgi:hypothetical protein
MLRPDIVAEVERLLALGCKQRAIARCLPICRGSVSRIALGRRDPSMRRKQSKSEPVVEGPTKRCSGCGGKTYLEPCLVCRDRQAITERLKRARETLHRAELPFMQEDEPLGMNLKGRHQERYEQLHQVKFRNNPSTKINLAQRAHHAGIVLDTTCADPVYEDPIFVGPDLTESFLVAAE